MADAPPHKPPTRVELLWEHDLVFAATSGSVRTTLDSASVAGQSPMQALAFGLAGCMSMDLVHILRKGRLNLTGLKADLTGHRTSRDPPSIRLGRSPFHGDRQCSRGSNPARHRPLPREVLLRLALDAPGHRAQRHLRGHDRRLTALHASLETDAGARNRGSGTRPVRPGFSSRRGGRFQRIPQGLPRLGPGHRRPRHDRSARRRQLDGGARSVQ